MQDGLLQVASSRESIPELIRLLVTAEIKVYGIYADNVSLEDQFLELSGGEHIVWFRHAGAK